MLSSIPLSSSLLMLFLVFLFHHFLSTYAKSVIEPCKSSDSCNALLSYTIPYDSELSEIAFKFQVNLSSLLASNSIDPTTSFSGNQILRAKSVLKVPVPCSCVNGIRQYALVYEVHAADTVESISVGFGNLISAQQIRSINDKIAVTNGRKILILLPCKCFDNSHNGLPSVYMSYVVKIGEELSSIGAMYGVTVNELLAVNGIGKGNVEPGDILAIPIPACSSENLGWLNETLILPRGSYTLTANDCIKCSCGRPADINLQCSASGLGDSCPQLRCKGSDLFIGEANETHTNFGCNVTKCVYRGHFGRKIHSRLVESSYVKCLTPGNGSDIAIPPDSAWHNPLVPSLQDLSPSLSPWSPVPDRGGLGAGNSSMGQMGSSTALLSGGGSFVLHVYSSTPVLSCFGLVLLFYLLLF